MITMDELRALARSEVNVKDKKHVTLVLDPQVSAAVAVRSLENYFGHRVKQQAIRLVLGNEEVGYLLRSDLYTLVALGTRGIGDADGATLPGGPSGIALIELCCPTAGCLQVLLVTRYNKNDPPTCDEHGTVMVTCK